MGFFKRLLSAGSKRSKKSSSAKGETQDLRRRHSQTLSVLSEVESEAAANRLLRSASSRLGVLCNSAGDEPLPPLPNRERTPSLCCTLLTRPPCKAHPEVNDDEADTRSLPFLPNRKSSSCWDAEFYSQDPAHPLISRDELNSLTTLSPRGQGFLVHNGSILTCLQGCSVIDIRPTPEPTREPTPPPRMTYIVKVHERTVISRTEFPNAIPSLATPTKERPKSVPLPTADLDASDDECIGSSKAKRPTITPRDQNRLLRLRQDPSVVSLLNMYDSQGRLDNNVFSNSPVKDDQREEEQVYTVGRPQHQRRGSTLRQLMGKLESEVQPNSSHSEGEISWAERLLQ